MEKVNSFRIETGTKIYCEGQKHAYKLEEGLNKLNIETRVGCNEAGMWSVYIASCPKIVNQWMNHLVGLERRIKCLTMK